jgi:DNA replication factor GINS
MGFDDLRSILLSERETGKLLQIAPDIFDHTHAEIAALLKKVYAIEDPLSDEARALIEETIAIKETMHELFAIRSRKILALALMHAEGNYYDREEVKRMIPSEREMFDRVAAGLEECQAILLHNTKQPLVPVPPVVPAGADPLEDEGDAVYEEVPPAAEGLVPVSAAPSTDAPSLTPPYMLVRVLGDMDSFMGVDGRIYTLLKGDIVTLPERNASVLSDRNIVVALPLPTCK